MSDAVKIGPITETTVTNAQGQLVKGIQVEFSIGTDGPFRTALPAPEFSEVAVRAEIDRVAAEIAKLKERRE